MDRVEIMQALREPFPEEAVSWRVGSTTRDKDKGMALAYIDARDVMDRLDSIFGIDGWMDSYEESASGRLICTLSLKIGDKWISRSDGAGETAMEGAKGAISDAFKRAAVKFGIGRYLYRLPAVWVEIVQFGKSYRIAKHVKMTLPDWAKPKPARVAETEAERTTRNEKFAAAVAAVTKDADTRYSSSTVNDIFDATLTATVDYQSFTELVAQGSREEQTVFYTTLKEELK